MPVMATAIRHGVRLHYSDLGAGPAVFFHTGGGGDGTMWKTAGYVDGLPGRRHLLFDHRGHGRSDKPERLEAHRMVEYIADVIAVLDNAGVDRAAMVGYSDGARLIYALAARHPERVVALVGIGGVGLSTDTYDYRLRLATDVRQPGLRTYVEQMSAGETEPAPAWLIENLAATSGEMLPLTARTFHASWLLPSSSAGRARTPMAPPSLRYRLCRAVKRWCWQIRRASCRER